MDQTRCYYCGRKFETKAVVLSYTNIAESKRICVRCYYLLPTSERWKWEIY